VAVAYPIVLDDGYRRAVAELKSQGACSRKRSRHEGHVPVWGDAEWDVRVDQPRNGAQDILEARGMAYRGCNQTLQMLTGAGPAFVSIIHEITKSTDTTNKCSTHATFPGDALRWVPRKRHNTRWPIEPKAATTRMVAALQPLIDFDVPAAVEPMDTMHRIDGEGLGRRSTRRLSRRVSLFPGDMSPQKVSLITLTPARTSHPAISPVKRSPIAPSPVRVAESPLRSFRVNATPVKVVLESPKASLPHESPSKPSPVPAISKATPTITAEASGINPTTRMPNHAPLVFDQPTQDATTEPQYEAQRRRSLQLARRSDRRASGLVRAINFEGEGDVPNRRHSFTSSTVPSDDAKARRRTLDAFFSASEDGQDDALAPDAHGSPVINSHSNNEAQEIDETDISCAVFKIDAGTNLDIFGQWKTLSRSALPGQPVDADIPSPVKAAHYYAAESSGPAAPAISEESDAIIASPVRNALGVTYVASKDESALGQAAMYPSPDALEAEQHNSNSEFTSHSTLGEDSPMFGQEEDDSVFELRDPEGLSTIYEESLLMDTEAEVVGIPNSSAAGYEDASIPASSLCADPQPSMEPTVCCEGSSPAPTPSRKVVQVDGSPQLMHTDCKADSRALADHAPEMTSNERSAAGVSTNHVVTMVDVLFKPDSPHHDHKFTTEASNLLGSEKMGNNAGSPSPSKESVSTPENNFYISPSDIQTKADGQQTVAMGSITSIESDQNDGLSRSSSPRLNQTPLSASFRPPLATATPPGALNLLDIRADVTMDIHRRESSGFTPINGRQISPPSSLTRGADDQDSEVEVGDIEDMAMMEDETTEAIDDDFTLTVVAPRVENDTLTLQASHDDSETEMLRKFVTRVTADKNAKAAAAAAALATKSGRPKRRSGSTGSTASSTGSPIAKLDTPHKRTPLGEKNTNSPSPVKKRKHVDDLGKSENDILEVSEDLLDAPKLKRRRKRVDPVLESASDSLKASLNSPASSEAGPRRSTRSRSSRVALKPAAPSANSIALSLIPVRLPGMGVMDDTTMDMQLMMAKSRSEEKDVTSVTRVNTRKNKGNSIHPKLVLARQAEDPAAWRMKELKMVFDAKESRSAEAKGDSAADGRKSRKAKGVRWAEELVRFQGDEVPSVFKAMASSLLADIMMGDAEEEDETPVAQLNRAPEPAEPEQAERAPSTPAKKTLPRRTRSSRLLAPKPVDKIADMPAVSPAPPPRSMPLPKIASLAAAAPTVAPTAKAGMGTRRSKIAKLGMGVNGTPAPKRRGRPTI